MGLINNKNSKFFIKITKIYHFFYVPKMHVMLVGNEGVIFYNNFPSKAEEGPEIF